MFQRIYEETQEEIDSLSEKFIAFFGRELLNYQDLCDLEFKYIKDFNEEPINIQRKYLKYLVQTKKYLRSKQLGDSSLGNTIELMIDKHLTHYYLLKQSMPENKKKLLNETDKQPLDKDKSV
jgi:DNA-binding ferritin-like protein